MTPMYAVPHELASQPLGAGAPPLLPTAAVDPPPPPHAASASPRHAIRPAAARRAANRLRANMEQSPCVMCGGPERGPARPVDLGRRRPLATGLAENV